MSGTWLETVPDELLNEVLSRLSAASDLCSVALASRRLNALVEDRLWGAVVVGRLPRLVALLDASPSPPEWWAARSWRSRLSALVGGKSFDAQVFNRELENEQEDFLLSCYDASCSLSPAAAAVLRSGDAAAPLHFTARYLSMGRMPAVMEAEVAAERLRLAPAGSRPYAVYGGGSLVAPGLRVGEEVEVQWKGRRLHPYGWWLGTVLSVRGGRITLMFRQYPRTSVWHRVKAPIRPGKETVVNGDCSFGYVGGLRRLAPDEREEWRRHGAPQPPAPELLQALEAAAEEEWSDEEELDLDVELAAELEDELEELAAVAAHPAPAAVDAEAAAGEGAAQQPAAAAAVGPEAAGDEEAEEAGFAPAAPPREPIALHLGQDGGAAAPQQGGLAVVLAAALPPVTAPLQAQP